MSEIDNNVYISKLDSLKDTRDKKLANLNKAPDLPYEQVTLESMRDGDSLKFVDVVGGLGAPHRDGTIYDRTNLPTADRVFGGLDTYEVFPDNPGALKYNTEDPNGIAKMERQRRRLAESRNVPVDQITNEDVYEEGAKGTFKSLALLQAYEEGDQDYIQKVRDWNPSPETTKQWRTSAPKFGSSENPLNIKAERHFTGTYDSYGRPLSTIRPIGSKYLIGVEGGGYSYDGKDFKGYSTSIPTEINAKGLADELRTAQAAQMDKLDQVFNGVRGFGATFISELLINPIDAVGDQFELFDIGTEEEKTKQVNKLTGYNPELLDQAMLKISNQWDIITDPSASVADKAKAALSGIIEAYVTPEMLGTSFGALLAWLGPGKFANLFGVGTKFANTTAKISARVDAGEITAEAGRLEKLKALGSVDGAKALLTAQSGQLVSAIGNVNNQYEQFVANNGGNELEGADKAEFFAVRLGVQLVNQNIDAFTDIKILQAPGVLTSLIPAAKNMTNKEFSNAAKVFAKGIGITLGTMGLEAAQEYAQTTMELFNSRYGSELFKDADTFIKFMQDERNYDEAGIAALAGAGGAAQFQTVGSVLPLTGASIAGLRGIAQRNASDSDVSEETDTPPTEDEVKTAKQEYAALLSRLSNDVKDGKVTPDNILSYLEDVEKLNETKHVIGDAPPHKIERGEAGYEAIISGLEKFIVDHADLKLTKKITRKTLQESMTDNRAAKALESLPDASKIAFQKTAEALGSGEEYTFEKSVKVVQKFVSKSYDKAVEDEEVMGPFIRDLEQALTNNISDTTKESFGKVKEALDKFSKTQTLPKTDSTSTTTTETATETATEKAIYSWTEVPPENATETTPGTATPSTVLGTGPKFTIEEQEYDDFSRTTDATRIIGAVLGAREGKVSPETAASMHRFARTQGVSESSLNNLIKSYESVDEEAISGSRGYATRAARIKGLLSSSKPDLPLLRKEWADLSRMVDAIDRSVGHLRTGIKEIEAKAARLNKDNSLNGGGRNLIKYMQLNKKTGKYDVPFNINIVKNAEGKWQADTTIAKKNLAKKEGYLADIKKERLLISRKANSITPGVVDAVGTVQIPTAVGTAKESRERDQTYLSNITETLRSISDKFSFPNKIILGEKPSNKWQAGGDYRKANALNINPEEFDSTDVVLLNDLGSKKIKGKALYTPNIVSTKSNDKLTPEQQSFKAAVDAGAVIVLDRDLLSRKGKNGKEAKNAYDAFRTYLTNKGYEFLEKEGTIAFVKPTPETADIIKKLKEDFVNKNAVFAEKKKDKASLISLYRALETEIDPKDGSDLTDERKSELKQDYNTLFVKVQKADFKDSAENLSTHLKNASTKEVAKLGTDILSDPDPLPLSYKDKALEKAVQTFIDREENADIRGKELLAEWKDAKEKEQQTGKKLERTISSLLSRILGKDVAPRALVKSLLSPEKSFAAGKDTIYEGLYVDRKDKQTKVVVIRDLTDKIKEKFENDELNIRGHRIIGIRPVTQDATKLVELTHTTVLNSVPTEALPFTLRDISKKFTDNVFQALAKVGEAELSEQTDAKKPDGKFVTNGFFLHNSPARGIIFNKEGKPNPEVIAAMYLAIGELLLTDSRTLMIGYKNDVDIAAMFNVQEHQITPEMRDIARNNGALVKTVASKLGTSIFKQLGLSRKQGKDIAEYEYDALVADIGNSAIVIAEMQGLLDTTTPSSNTLAKAFKDGEVRKLETNTRFVNIKSVGKQVDRYINHEPVAAVTQFKKGFEEVEEDFPGAVTGRTGAFFDPPTEERIAAATSKVRNDIIGLHVPEAAKETITHLMNTAYEYSSIRVNSFLEAVGDIDNEENLKNNKVLAQLGYVHLESDKFKNMYYKDKDVQEVANREILHSISTVKKLKEQVEARGDADPSLYFDYSYIGNNRYQLDSNTVNPQNDKLHRFLFLPKGASLNYTITQHSESKGLLFTGTDADGKISDESFSLRYSIAQAFGKGVDKMKASSVIEYSDVILGLSQEHLKDIRTQVLETGKYEIQHNGKPYLIKADHLTHTLHALDTLEAIKEATKPGGTGNMQSSLISEIDSLTNGFANKLQQMPILSNMSEHFARVGILTKEFQDGLADNVKYKGPGEGFDPTKGDSVAGLLEEGTNIGFRDSYQNLAGQTINGLMDGEVVNTNLTKHARGLKGISGVSMFEAVKVLMPGGPFLAAASGEGVNTIDGILRELFKEPFMIFNYSAGIKRIVKNLGLSVADTIARDLAMADTNDPEQLHKKQSAEDLLESVIIYDPDKKDDTRITTVDRLQQVLKDHALNTIKIEPMVIASTYPEKKHLQEALSTMVENTYGTVVQKVFETTFEPFIKVQEAMNNSFKVAFRIFDAKRMEMLKELRNKNVGAPLTKEDHAKVLEALWDDFPWIVGPLTGASNRTEVRDVIAVISTSAKSPNEIIKPRKSPQAELGTGMDKGTRTANPLIKYLEEAVSSGSVLPFHATDGAEMSYIINTIASRAMAAIHDATIVSNSMQDVTSWTYHEGMVKINQDNEKGYVLADAMEGLGKRIEATIKSKDFATNFAEVTAKGLKGIKDEVGFPAAAQQAVTSLKTQVKIIKDARKLYYGPGGKMEGAIIGNMAAGPGGAYKKGDTAPDTSYKKALEKLYSQQTVEFVKTVDKESLQDVYDGLDSPAKKDILKILRNLDMQIKEVGDILGLSVEDRQIAMKALTVRANSVKSNNSTPETITKQYDRFNDVLADTSTEVNVAASTDVDQTTIDNTNAVKEANKEVKECDK